jgi:cytochrome c peroxidase
MAGTADENEIGAACEVGITSGWQAIENRIRSIPAYEPLFLAAYPELQALDDLTIVHIGNALGAFVTTEWQTYSAPFDGYLAGDKTALTQTQVDGAKLFYGEGNCASCHSGVLLTDQSFHAIGMPQFGPGKNEVAPSVGRDLGRYNETSQEDDRYRFRTPSLRNISETAPYGHTGAYSTLEAVVRHHLNPKAALRAYSTDQPVLSTDPTFAGQDFLILSDEDELIRLAAASELPELSLTDDQISDLVSFLESLTDPASLKGRLGVPKTVPSGLQVD